ncbi:MAG: hypothetical protein E7329_08330 [Clostridiales bacterium]|nr:hypothetical protein [Clostridiales bacterium]
MEKQYILGLDGGGTKTDAALCMVDGTLVKRVVGGPSSITGRSVDDVRNTLEEVIGKVTMDYGGPDCIDACYAGISGGGLPGNRQLFHEMLKEILPSCPHIANGTDAVNVLSAGIGSGNGIIAIAGTGASIFARVNGEMHQVSGWGYLLGDEGSGYDLGRRALMKALYCMDGRGGSTSLFALCENKAGVPLREYVPALYRMDAKTEIASFAPILLEAAALGDAVAMAEVNAAASDMAHAILTADQMIRGKCAVMGGSIWKNQLYQDLVQHHLGAEFKMIFIDLPPVYGAVVEAAGLLGFSCAHSFKENFRSTLHLMNENN